MPAGLGLIGRFVVGLSADTKPLQRDLGRGVRRVSEFERSFRKLTLAANRAARPLADITKRAVSLRGAMTLLAGGGAFGAVIKRSTDLGASLVEASGRVGLTVEQFQELQRVFEGDGLAADKFEKAMGRLANAVTQAGQGLSTYTRAFDELGVAYRDVETGALRGAAEVIADLSDAFPKLTSQTEKLGLVQQIFGSRSQAVLTVLDRGSASLSKQREEMRSLGVVTDRNATTLKALSQDFTDLSNVVQTTLANAIASAAGNVRDLVARLQALAIKHTPAAIDGLVSVGETTANIAGHWRALVAIWAGSKFVGLPAQLLKLDGIIQGLRTSTISWATATKGLLWPSLAAIGGTLLVGLVLYRKQVKGVLMDINEALGGQNIPDRKTADSFAFGAAGAGKGDPALQRVLAEYKETYAALRSAEERAAFHRDNNRRQYLRYVDDVEKLTERLGKLARRRADIERRIAADAGKMTEGAGAAAVSAPFASDLDSRAAALAGKLVEMERERAKVAAEGEAARLVYVHEVTREIASQEDFAARFLARQEEIRNLSAEIAARQIEEDTYARRGERGLADEARNARRDLEARLAMVREIGIQYDRVSTIATNMPPLLGEPHLVQRNVDSLMSLVPQFTLLETRAERFGVALKESFSGLDRQIQGIIGQTDSWGEALDRVGRLLVYIGTSALLDPNGPLAALFGGTGKKAVGNRFFSRVAGKALGGSMQAGSPYWAGERGPELIIPRTDASAIPLRNGRGNSAPIQVTTILENAGPVDASVVERVSDAAVAKMTAILGQREYERQMSRRDG